MSMKRTDLEKKLAKKLDGRLKSSLPPQRFAQGAAVAAAQEERKASKKEAAPKLVPLACRLPADLVARLRERAVAHEGGIHGLMTEAAEAWLSKKA
ncbi:MAG: hypothetical protein C0423_14420 [Methylibium sp.]|nr:hypothetical protein [Methylibium sp.]